MNQLTHASIIAAGQYRDLKIGKGEEKTTRDLHAFMLRLRMCEEALARA